MKYWIVKDSEKYYRIGNSQKPKGYSEVYSCPDEVEKANDAKIVDKSITVMQKKLIRDESGEPVMEIIRVEDFNSETGEILLDENNDPIMKDEIINTYEKDENGDIIQEVIVVAAWKEVELDQEAKNARIAIETAKALADQIYKDANQYKEDRRRAYPPIGDQLDAIYKKLSLDDSTDYDAISAKITKIKKDNPKPE